MSTTFHFGRYEFSSRTLELRRGGRVVPLAPQPARVLRLFLESPGELLLRGEIQDRIWPDEPSRVTRDQGLNTCVRQIRDALGEDASSPTYIETCPRRGYRWVAPVEAVEEAGSGSGDVPDPPRSGSRWRRAAGWTAAAILAVVALAGVRHGPPAGPPADDPAGDRTRIAVLPFDDLSADGGNEAFALGLSEEVTTRLASLAPDRLDVVAFASSLRSDPERGGVPAAGRRVGASYVLDGSIRREGERLRLSARLVDADDGTHVWADHFEGEFGSLLDLQASLGSRVSAAILPSLPASGAPGAAAGGGEPDPAARLPYLEGVHLLGWETPEGARAAVGRLREAVRLDPDFAGGHATLARALFWSGRRDAAERSARRALALDAGVPEAHMVLAEVLLDRDFAFEAADGHFRRAIELAPRRPAFLRAYAHHLTVVGRHAEALRHLETARELNPLSPALDGDAGWHLYLAGRHEEAARRCDELAPLMRGVVRARAERCALHALRQLGRLEAARARAVAVMEIAGADEAAVRRVAEAPAGDALDLYTAWSLEPGNRAVALGGDSPYTRARALADLGRTGRAMAALEEAHRTRPRGYLMLAVEPRFSPLRDRERFARLVRQIGFPDGADGAPATGRMAAGD